MEDLYGNLENYNEVNALQELKSENTQLKMKLEEYTGSLDKLQKDFDSLSSEFKKLEYNYSSLLKTARAEIERKTQMITNMNMEKDMLVLAALKNGNKSVLHMKKNIPSYNKTNNEDKGNDRSVQKRNFQKMNEDKMQSNRYCEPVENIRSQKYSTPTNDKVNNITMENTIQKPETCSRAEQNTEASKYVSDTIRRSMKHENIPHNAQFKPMDIKSRRKSIPATSVEGEKFCVGEKADSMIRDPRHILHLRDKEDRKSFHKFDNDGHSSKSSESSSRDERMLGYCRPSRDIYKTRHFKYDNEKHRIKDQYDTSQRHTRYSPERYKRPPRDYYDENWHRPDFNRIRNRESPDKFHHNSYKEHRAHYDKNNCNDPDRYMYNQERHVAKHKIPYDYQESYAKRPKPHYDREKEGVRWNDKQITEHQELTETFERLQEQYTSCRSPDYVDSEIPDQPMKVIMDTAEIPQEDPRIANSKYIFRNDNGLVSLSTTVGRDVDLKPVDKLKWNLKTVSMPDALIQPPNEELSSKDLCKEIEEIQPMLQINSGVLNIDSKPIQNKDITKDKQTENCHEDADNRFMNKDKLSVEIPIQDCLTNYTNPKIKRNHQEVKLDTANKDRSLEIIDPLCPIANNTHKDKQKSPSGSSRLPLRNVGEQDKILSNHLNSALEQQLLKNNINEHDKRRILSTREIVEGDLELSDETSDNIEMQTVLNNNSLENNEKPYDVDILDNKCNVTVKDKEIQETRLLQYCDMMEDHTEYSKRQKMKKKIHKHKDSEHIETVDKKSKTKKDKKETPKEITSKFNDLFGESSSLITPTDLGFPASDTQSSSQNTVSYMPIFEDAQDATDLEQKLADNITKSKSFENFNTNAENKDERHEELDSKIDNISKNPLAAKHYETEVSKESLTNTKFCNTKLQNVIQESDVVTTIIISTGVQPDEINTESRAESLVNAEELLSDDIGQDQEDATHKTQDVVIKALATSTPYKQVQHIESKLPDSTCTSNSTLTSAGCADMLVSKRNNTMEPPNEDLPDVRIFVKRRRRTIKSIK